MGGAPYTKMEFDRDEHEWYEASDNWKDENAERLPFYVRTDLKIEGSHFFDTINLTVFLEVDNLEELIFNRKNIHSFSYSDYGKKENVYQFQTLFIAGFVFEF